MDKGQLALDTIKSLCRHLALKGVLTRDMAADIVGALMENAVAANDRGAIDFLDDLERVIFETAPSEDEPVPQSGG